MNLWIDYGDVESRALVSGSGIKAFTLFSVNRRIRERLLAGDDKLIVDPAGAAQIHCNLHIVTGSPSPHIPTYGNLLIPRIHGSASPRRTVAIECARLRSIEFMPAAALWPHNGRAERINANCNVHRGDDRASYAG